MIETSLRSLLLADVVVSGLVATRIYPAPMPQRSTFPLITYQRVSRTSEMHLDAPSFPTRVRVQMDCWAQDFDGARVLGEAVFDVLHGYAGRIDGVAVNLVALEVERGDQYEPDTQLWRVSSDWMVVCKEGVA